MRLTFEIDLTLYFLTNRDINLSGSLYLRARPRRALLSCSDVDDLRALNTIVLRAAFRELLLGYVVRGLEQLAPSGLLEIDERSAVDYLLGQDGAGFLSLAGFNSAAGGLAAEGSQRPALLGLEYFAQGGCEAVSDEI